MNKQSLVAQVAKRTKLPQDSVEKVLLATLEEIQVQLEKGNDVTLMGFGTFLVGKRKGGAGYNPHTGGKIEVAEMKLPKFRAGKGFKERLNKKS
jgi:DNA-binding protein HU-beta